MRAAHMSTTEQVRLAAEIVKKRLHLDDGVAGPLLAAIVRFALVVFLAAVFQQPGS